MCTCTVHERRAVHGQCEKQVRPSHTHIHTHKQTHNSSGSWICDTARGLALPTFCLSHARGDPVCVCAGENVLSHAVWMTLMGALHEVSVCATYTHTHAHAHTHIACRIRRSSNEREDWHF